MNVEIEGYEIDLSLFPLYEIKYRLDTKNNIQIKFGQKYYDLNTPRGIEYLKSFVNNDLELIEKVFPIRFDSTARIYQSFVNNVNADSSEKKYIIGLITSRLNQFYRRNQIGPNSDIHIRFVIRGNEDRISSKSFNTFKYADIERFVKIYTDWVDMTTSDNENYTYNIEKIVIKIVLENAGGCNIKRVISKSANVTSTSDGDTDNNNCFFRAIQRFSLFNNCTANQFKILSKNIKSNYLLSVDDPIPISVGLDIFKYHGAPLKKLQIRDMDTKEVFGVGDDSIDLNVCQIILEKGHYSFMTLNEKIKCSRCLKLHSKDKKHVCNKKRIMYANAMIKKEGRPLRCHTNLEDIPTTDHIIHYDIETATDGNSIHTPYIIGFSDENGLFKSFHGDDCIKQFVDYLLTLKGDWFINAFNGSNFDHYFLIRYFLDQHMSIRGILIANSSIIKFRYTTDHGTISLIDIRKHLMGSLKQNLISFNCNTLKGDFDHALGGRWETLSEDTKKKCITYLIGDVMGLKELYEKLNTEVFNKTKLNISSFISTSSLTYTLWKMNIQKDEYEIYLPSLDQEKVFRESVRGGRTYKSKSSFKSQQYNDYLTGKIDFNSITDYIIDADVVSLYPTAMANYPYPVGLCYKLEGSEMKGEMGIYDIEFKTNKNLQHSIGGRRTPSGLKWDLEDGGGVYTSVDIEDMIANGYYVKIKSGYYWLETAYIFKDYINDLFKKKNESKKGSVEYQLSKLYMNALYGKLIQRPIYNRSEVIRNNTDYWAFYSKNIITDVESVGPYWILTGYSRMMEGLENCINKPTHLGSFVLAYSRRIMLEYFKESNQYFDSPNVEQRINNDFYYTDTDSIFIHASNANSIKRLNDHTLGGMSNDLGTGSKIIVGLWIAPKLYAIGYVKEGSNNLHYTFRGKGLCSTNLNWKSFEEMNAGSSMKDVRDFSMKRVNYKRSGTQQDIPQFSILHYSKNNDRHRSRLTRVVNTKQWDGRMFINDNQSIPWGGFNH